METLKMARMAAHLSQRALAKKAKVAYKTLQLLESGEARNPSLEVLGKLAKALSLCAPQFQAYVADYFAQPPDSVAIVSRKIVQDGDASWKTHLFNFVDAWRRDHDLNLISSPPHTVLSHPLQALLAATVETLCDEDHMAAPLWCMTVLPLPEPWFVSGIENLKATAVQESPIHFRSRTIFVLASFLERA
jgi:transcriptional regulator with XRE-family HTH domain